MRRTEAQRVREKERERNRKRDLYPEGTRGELLYHVYSMEHAKRTAMYRRINVSPSEIRE